MTSLAGYKQLQISVLATTLGLVAFGSLTLFCLDSGASALPFAVGGSAGLAYQWLLQRRVDSIGSNVGPQQASLSLLAPSESITPRPGAPWQGRKRCKQGMLGFGGYAWQASLFVWKSSWCP